MSANSFNEPQKRSTLLPPILVGGSVAGTLDQVAAFVSSGFNVPRVVAAGLLGPQIIHSIHSAFWILGLALHFLIAFSAAVVHCIASGKLDFLKKHFVVCGLFFGIAVFLLMYLVVMPLCAFHYKDPTHWLPDRAGYEVHDNSVKMLPKTRPCDAWDPT